MICLQDIYDDYNRHDISLFPYMSSHIDAATIEIGGQYAVFANFFKFKSIPELKLMLIHELGHCVTGATHKISSDYDLIEQHELKADKYAATKYLPPESLAAAFNAGYTQIWELAEWFDLPEEFISWAVDYYKNNGLLPGAEILQEDI